MTTDFKRNSSGRTRIYEYTPPPPINALVSALVAATLRFHLYSFQRLSLRYLWSFVKSPYGIKISQERFWERTVVLAFLTFSYVPEFLEVSKFLQIGLKLSRNDQISLCWRKNLVWTTTHISNRCCCLADTPRFHLCSFQRLSLRYLWSFVKSPYGIESRWNFAHITESLPSDEKSEFQALMIQSREILRVDLWF